jgi:hypothetical protein
MQVFLIERVIPPAFDTANPDQVALHSRWATDAYQAVGIVWYGGVVAGGRMYSMVAADDAGVIERYRESLHIAPEDMIVRKVDTFIGPAAAMAHSDPRFRGPRAP